MAKSVQTVKVPVPAYQCNLVVFPAAAYFKDISMFYVLQMKDYISTEAVGSLEVEYISGMIYCFLPSTEKWNGYVTMYTSKPTFIDSYIGCMEVNVKSLIFSNCRLETFSIDGSGNNKILQRCVGCFVNHFPSPSTLKCLLRKQGNL